MAQENHPPYFYIGDLNYLTAMRRLLLKEIAIVRLTGEKVNVIVIDTLLLNGFKQLSDQADYFEQGEPGALDKFRGFQIGGAEGLGSEVRFVGPGGVARYLILAEPSDEK